MIKNVSNLLRCALFAPLALTALAATETETNAPAAASAKSTGPNIILIFADDLGMDAVHCTGGPFPTPNIDKLATEGTLFERCYSTPLYGPSRCEVLTGRYPFRTGHVSNQSADAISPSKEIMIPTVLKKAGYATACAGKWGQLPLEPND
jgi:arylsulfatase A-like enzyme